MNEPQDMEVSRVAPKGPARNFDRRGRIRGIIPALKRLDERFGRLNHRLIAVHSGEWCWTCPTCRADNVYRPEEAPITMVGRLNRCCEKELRGQFPGTNDEVWRAFWEAVDRKREAEANGNGVSEEPVRAGADGSGTGGSQDGGGDPPDGQGGGGTEHAGPPGHSVSGGAGYALPG